MKVTAIRRERSDVPRMDVYLDGERRLSLPDEVVLTSGIRTGDELEEAEVAKLRTSGAVWDAREAALAMLNRRARTQRDLRQRLLAREHPVEAVDTCIEQLVRAGLVDDGQYARAFVRERLRTRPKGVAALKAELRGRGVDARTAEQAISESMGNESVTELELARAAARKFRPRTGEESIAARRRLYGFLSRRGFSGEAISRILAERTGSNEDDRPGDA